MYRLPIRLVVLLVVLALPFTLAGIVAAASDPVLPHQSLTALNQDHGEEEEAGQEVTTAPGGDGQDLKTVALWTISGIAAAAVFLTALYMLKRKIGGFDNPEWVAPITILYSKDAPAEGAFGESGGDAHAAHGAHH